MENMQNLFGKGGHCRLRFGSRLTVAFSWLNVTKFKKIRANSTQRAAILRAMLNKW